MAQEAKELEIRIPLTDRELHLHHVYEWVHIANDLALGLEFLIGTIFFFPGHNEIVGVWLFFIGSAQMIIRPAIRIANKLHVPNVIKRTIEF